MTYGETDAESVARGRIDYWALGGEHAGNTLTTSPRTAHYAGTPQGRSPMDVGPRGCTLVDVQPDGETRLRFIATDVIRWQTERVPLDTRADKRELSRLLQEKMRALVDGSPSRDLLVSWKIVTDGPLAVSLRRGGLAEQIAGELRQEFGHRQTVAWTVSLVVESPRQFPRHWYEEDTILGDFVRALRDHQAKGGGLVRPDFPAARTTPGRPAGGRRPVVRRVGAGTRAAAGGGGGRRPAAGRRPVRRQRVARRRRKMLARLEAGRMPGLPKARTARHAVVSKLCLATTSQGSQEMPR